MSENNAYDRAVAQFEAVATAPSEHIISNPAQLSRQANLARATGYRLALLAEAQSVLQREPTGTYRCGSLLLRAGLSALGFGNFAFIAPPLLVELRQSANLTAFLYVISDGTLRIGPYSLGRSSDFVRPNALYQAHSYDPVQAGDQGTLEISCTMPDQTKTQRMTILHGAQSKAGCCGLGLMLPPHLQTVSETGKRALTLAVKRFSAASKERTNED